MLPFPIVNTLYQSIIYRLCSYIIDWFTKNGVRNLAEELQKKSLQIKERVLGEAHPNAQIILENMKIAFYKWNPEGIFEQWLEENKKEQ